MAGLPCVDRMGGRSAGAAVLRAVARGQVAAAAVPAGQVAVAQRFEQPGSALDGGVAVQGELERAVAARQRPEAPRGGLLPRGELLQQRREAVVAGGSEGTHSAPTATLTTPDT